MRFNFPIAGKLVAMTVGILLCAMVYTALETSNMFREVSGRREEDANRSQAKVLASEVEGTVHTLIEKMTVTGTLMVKAVSEGGGAKSASGKSLQFMFERDRDLVTLAVYVKARGKLKVINRLVNDEYLRGYKLDKNYLKLVNKKVKFPVASVFAGNITLKNRSLPQSAPLLTMGIPLVKDNLGRVTHVAVADIQLRKIQKSFADERKGSKKGKRLRTSYLVDKQGTVLAHPDEVLSMRRASLKKVPVVKKALKAKMSEGQLRYKAAKEKEHYIASFKKASLGMVVVSEAPESLILAPAKRVERQVYKITGYVVSGALFIIFIFSLTLTRPIEKLVLFALQVAQGNFDLIARSVVKSRDEVGTLALAFDSMVDGLRERDKVKNLFSKFHGSSVAEDLLASGEVKLGGTRKRVVIFFSDIRGFTSFSESREPEEVVGMLNEYLTAMVSNIYKHNGIVDKFIGDAIMAVWGAPETTGMDSQLAMKACIDMRESLQTVNEARVGRGEDPIMIGMGVHVGEAISGNMGSEDRMEYTVIGNTVNTAARIEASTKAFGADLLLSEEMANEVEKEFIVELAGGVEVKGRSDALKLYKVRGYYGEDGEKVIVKTDYSDYKAEGADKVKLVGDLEDSKDS